MNQFQVLAEVVFPVEGPLVQLALLTRRIVVAFCVGIIRLSYTTECTAKLTSIRIRHPWAFRAAHPPLQ